MPNFFKTYTGLIFSTCLAIFLSGIVSTFHLFGLAVAFGFIALLLFCVVFQKYLATHHVS